MGILNQLRQIGNFRPMISTVLNLLRNDSFSLPSMAFFSGGSHRANMIKNLLPSTSSVPSDVIFFWLSFIFYIYCAVNEHKLSWFASLHTFPRSLGLVGVCGSVKKTLRRLRNDWDVQPWTLCDVRFAVQCRLLLRLRYATGVVIRAALGKLYFRSCLLIFRPHDKPKQFVKFTSGGGLRHIIRSTHDLTLRPAP